MTRQLSLPLSLACSLYCNETLSWIPPFGMSLTAFHQLLRWFLYVRDHELLDVINCVIGTIRAHRKSPIQLVQTFVYVLNCTMTVDFGGSCVS